jgi:Flp pilus assembly pilin Flp
MSMSQLFKRFKSDRRGANTVEYLVLLAFVGLGGIAAVQAIGKGIDTVGKDLGNKVNTLTPYTPAAPGG